MVFVPVSDMGRSVAWYSRLLGVPVGETSHEGRIHGFPMQDGLGLMLDSHRPVTTSSQPLFFLWTEDMRTAERFLRGDDVELVGGIEDIGSLLTLTFRDPDGNLLMVCQTKAS